jgi:hypothetical protein
MEEKEKPVWQTDLAVISRLIELVGDQATNIVSPSKNKKGRRKPKNNSKKTRLKKKRQRQARKNNRS